MCPRVSLVINIIPNVTSCRVLCAVYSKKTHMIPDTSTKICAPVTALGPCEEFCVIHIPEYSLDLCERQTSFTCRLDDVKYPNRLILLGHRDTVSS